MPKEEALDWLKTLKESEASHVLHHSHVRSDQFLWNRSIVAFINHSSLWANLAPDKSGHWKASRKI